MHSLERKLERLCSRLRRKTRVKDDRTPPSGQYLSTSNDESYQPRSRTPPSDSFKSSSQHTSGLRHHRKKFGTPPRRGQGHDAMGKALLQISHSPFSQRIKQAKLPRRFHPPTFTIYNGRTDPIDHVSHFSQRMAIHSKNKALMCKVFPSSLGPVAMRWFDNLAKGSIHSFKELTRAFRARFLTCSRVPRPLDSLLSMSMREGETLKTYFDRYWEIYNKIDRNFEDVVVQTFKVGLPTKSDLWKSLTMKPPRNMHQLMDRIEEHKRVEDNQNSTRGKTKVSTTD